MDRVFSLRADGSAVSLMQEDKRTEEQSPPCAGIKRDRGKVISAVLMSQTINVSPNVSGRAWEHSRRSGRRCAAVWIKKMKILSCGCMTRQTARIRVSSHRYTKWIRRIYCHAVLGSAGSNDHLFISNLDFHIRWCYTEFNTQESQAIAWGLNSNGAVKCR